MARKVPPALKPGDTIAVIAPASSISRELLEAGCQRLRQLGYVATYSDSILDEELYFAGSAERRTAELNEMFARKDVQAVICARGGYGTNYLLPRLDLDAIRAHPKIFMGYSDITSLLTYISDACEVVTYHGPMVTKDFAVANDVALRQMRYPMDGSSLDVSSGAALNERTCGSAEGMLYGGCLSMLVASLGTPYEINTGNTVLFIEDIAAKPFQVDRMLMQLKLAGKFDSVRAIVFGVMQECVQSAEQAYTLQEVIARVLGGLEVPIGYGFNSGHVPRQPNLALPIGQQVRVEITPERVRITG
jgi:muramoyltetrapeptide carboxypeptidase